MTGLIHIHFKFMYLSAMCVFSLFTGKQFIYLYSIYFYTIMSESFMCRTNLLITSWIQFGDKQTAD